MIFFNRSVFKTDNSGIMPSYTVNDGSRPTSVSSVPMTEDEGVIVSLDFQGVNERLAEEFVQTLLRIRIPKTISLDSWDVHNDLVFKRHMAKYIAQVIKTFNQSTEIISVDSEEAEFQRLQDLIFASLNEMRTTAQLTAFMVNFYATTYALPQSSTAVLAFRRVIEHSAAVTTMMGVVTFDTIVSTARTSEVMSDRMLRVMINAMSKAMSAKDLESMIAVLHPINPILLSLLYDIPKLPGSTMSVAELLAMGLPIPDAIRSLINRYYSISLNGSSVILTPLYRERDNDSIAAVLATTTQTERIGIIDEILPVMSTLMTDTGGNLVDIISANTNQGSGLRTASSIASMNTAINTISEVYLIHVLSMLFGGERQGYPSALGMLSPVVTGAMTMSVLIQALASLVLTTRVSRLLYSSVFVDMGVKLIETLYGSEVFQAPLIPAVNVRFNEDLMFTRLVDPVSKVILCYGLDLDIFTPRNSVIEKFSSVDSIGAASLANLNANKSKVKNLIKRALQLSEMSNRTAGTLALSSVATAFLNDVYSAGNDMKTPFQPDVITPVASGLEEFLKGFDYFIAKPTSGEGSCRVDDDSKAYGYESVFTSSIFEVETSRPAFLPGSSTLKKVYNRTVAWDTSAAAKTTNMTGSIRPKPLLTRTVKPGGYVTVTGTFIASKSSFASGYLKAQDTQVAWGAFRPRLNPASLMGEMVDYTQLAQLGQLPKMFVYKVEEVTSVAPFTAVPVEGADRYAVYLTMLRDVYFEAEYNNHLGELYEGALSTRMATAQQLVAAGFSSANSRGNTEAISRASVIREINEADYIDVVLIPMDAEVNLLVQTRPIAINPVALVMTLPVTTNYENANRDVDWVVNFRGLQLSMVDRALGSRIGSDGTTSVVSGINPFVTNLTQQAQDEGDDALPTPSDTTPATDGDTEETALPATDPVDETQPPAADPNGAGV